MIEITFNDGSTIKFNPMDDSVAFATVTFLKENYGLNLDNAELNLSV